MQPEPRPRVAVAVHAPMRAFAPGVTRALARLGYALVPPATSAGCGDPPTLRPTIRIVDDRELDRAPLECGREALPFVLLTGHRGPVTTDARAVGAIRRRARLGPLFDALQRAVERTPRTVPRVPTQLPLRAVRGERAFAGAIRTLSEKGCLAEGLGRLEPERRLELCFPLPGRGLIQVPAQASRIRDDGAAALVFRDASRETRRAIADYVARQLAG